MTFPLVRNPTAIDKIPCRSLSNPTNGVGWIVHTAGYKEATGVRTATHLTGSAFAAARRNTAQYELRGSVESMRVGTAI